MKGEQAARDGKEGVSTMKLALGAAGLFLFIVGVKRSFRFGEVAVNAGGRKEEPVREAKTADPEDWGE